MNLNRSQKITISWTLFIIAFLLSLLNLWESAIIHEIIWEGQTKAESVYAPGLFTVENTLISLLMSWKTYAAIILISVGLFIRKAERKPWDLFHIQFYMTKRIGILIILIGLCAFLISLAFLPWYNPRVGFLVNINHIDLVFGKGEGLITLPYKYFIIADIIFIFLGTVILLLSKSDKSIK